MNPRTLRFALPAEHAAFLTRAAAADNMTAEPESFDFITTFDAIHDRAKPLNVLRGIQRALKPDGVYLMQDISGSSHVHKDIEHPIGTFLYTHARIPAPGGVSLDHDAPACARHPEQLVRRNDVSTLP
ncbi:MAG TPA: methyltransferase domain-containing protein [Gemmatimonadales bacterium]|nr:methyltransferase domain-containing protein [Gemmatimonadales bacterium]